MAFPIQNLEIQERKGSARYSMVFPDHEITLNQHDHIIDITQSLTKTTPFVLSFSNLSYTLKTRPKFLPCFGHTTKTKLLLDKVSGQAKEGQIMAILGASGSGKSTLLDSLAGRVHKQSLNGTVTLNGQVLESRVLKAISAYVKQDDLLFPMLTVEETLMFSAELRLPRSVSNQKKKERVQTLINQLGLRAAANTMIGDEGHRGVSGGERRRVSIGVDIIHDPVLLFLDEPTSGLDSTSAFMVTKVLQRIARTGRIVIMSIHQPSHRIVNLLDNIMILSKGKIVYDDNPSNLSQFLSHFGSPVPENESAVEFALDLIHQLEQKPEQIFNLFQFNSNTKHHSQTITTSDPIQTLPNPSYINPIWVEIKVLSNRLLTNTKRTPEIFLIRLSVVLITGFILSTLFFQLDANPIGVQSRLSFLIFSIIAIFFICLVDIPVFHQERYIFIRETAYNAYRHTSYIISHSLISIPTLIILSLAFSISTYWSVGLSGGFIFYFLTIFSSFWSGSSFVSFISGLFHNIVASFIIGIACLSYFLLFSGFFITSYQIPAYWIWFHFVSVIKYPYEGVLMNEFGNSVRCFGRGVEVFDGTPVQDLPDSVKENVFGSLIRLLGGLSGDKSCVIDGSDILKQRGVMGVGKWSCFWITIAWGLFCRVLFYLVLLFGSKNKRR